MVGQRLRSFGSPVPTFHIVGGGRDRPSEARRQTCSRPCVVTLALAVRPWTAVGMHSCWCRILLSDAETHAAPTERRFRPKPGAPGAPASRAVLLPGGDAVRWG